MLARAKRTLSRFLGIDVVDRRVAVLHKQVEKLKMLSSKVLINQMKAHGFCDQMDQFEFSAFSQFGDDGIIQYLIHHIEIDHETFIEFGVEDYSEANTRFLLTNNNWRGLVMDSSKKNIERIRRQELYWKYDLTAIHCRVDRDNINTVIRNSGFAGSLGLLSIDIDGNDYWIWESIEAVTPYIVIIEYNSVFGPEHAITIPYDPNFIRTQAHYSNLYWGASLKALYILAEKKGYAFVGCNSSGNNAYFVKKDKLGKIRPVSVLSGFVKSKYRESRDVSGKLTFLAGDDRLQSIQDMSIVDIEDGRVKTIKTLEPFRGSH